jgi:hypothetical protein
LSRLIPVKYGKKNYPSPIEANICEIAGNFDVKEISPTSPYSLHTEYSYGKRAFYSISFYEKKIFEELELRKDFSGHTNEWELIKSISEPYMIYDPNINEYRLKENLTFIKNLSILWRLK